MKEFVLPFKPEELLAQPIDGRLWASDLPPVDEWSADQANGPLDELLGRVLKTQAYDITEEESFCLIFALLQGWARLETSVHNRVVHLLTEAARRASNEVSRLKKGSSGVQDMQTAGREARTVAKVLVFFLRWLAERVLRQNLGEAPATGKGRGRGRGRGGSKRGGSAASDFQEMELTPEELKEQQKALERHRGNVLLELANLLGKAAMAWLWNGDPGAWQQVAQAVSDAGFLVLDSAEAAKQKDVRQAALRCLTEPLLQEGHQHSNLLVATVSKLLHGLRSGEHGAAFAADALALAHTTPLPRLILVELTQHCNPAELTSQGAFQRALAAFLVAVAERLPHVVLANVSVLFPLLDVDCYPLRNAIVECIGHLLHAEGRKLPPGAHCRTGSGEQLVGDLDTGEEGQAESLRAEQAVSTFTIAPATKHDLLETLINRTLDKSVWVRYRVLQTLTGLAGNTRIAALPREQWARTLEIATRRMQDAAAMTRKASMQLVRTLIEFHPYGPALQGSGDERAKAEHLLREVAARLQKLREEEVAEAEKMGMKVEETEAQEPKATEDEADLEAEQEEAAMNLLEACEEHPELDKSEQKVGKKRLKKKTVTEQTITGEVDKCLEEADEGGDRAAIRNQQREALRRMQDCYTHRLRFVELLDAAEARLRGLLVSRTASDVTEAIGVVVELRLKGVPAAMRAFDQVLGLVWSRQASIKDAAVEAFHRMHLDGRDARSATRALLEMYEEGCASGSWTYTHLASVQELIQQAAEKELMDPGNAIPELVRALNGPACPMALRALTAFGAASAGSLAEQLPQINVLLGPGGSNAGGTAPVQLERARLLCQLLQRLLSCSKGPVADGAWDHIWALSQHCVHVVLAAFARCEVPPQWFGAAQAAMDLSFDLAMSGNTRMDAALRSPDRVWEQILQQMLACLLRTAEAAPAAQAAPEVAVAAQPIMDVQESEGEGSIMPAESPMQRASVCGESGQEDEVDQSQQAVVVAEPAPGPEVQTPQLACTVFIAGHLALRMLVYLEGVQSALKRKRSADEDARITEQREKSKKKQGGRKNSKAGDEEEDQDAAQASSLGMAGQEEREADAFAHLAEEGLLYGARSLLDKVKPLIFACLLDPELRKDPVLRRAGALSLCKFMTVSKRFCEENLQILFSVLFPKGKELALMNAAEDADQLADGVAQPGNALFEDLTLRQSLLVAVGDLLFRHPNVVEPWTGRLYGTLSSPAASGPEGASATELRLTALLVLTHLVLNDMMKPRAVLLVRALWLTACAHDATSRVARILFQELSKRSTNVVYNLLPEIIARLPEHQLGVGAVEGGCEGRVQYIMQFIEKEKHVEGLIEKLVLRLEQTANVAGTALAEDPIESTAAEGLDETSPPARAKETVSCLAHALGAMNYSDRCILRLHDAVVVRKAMHTALSYHAVARECLMGVVEKARRPRGGGKEKAGEAPPPEEPAAPAAEGAGAKGGASAAAMAAVDAIEQTVTALEKGKEEEAEALPQPIADAEASAPPASAAAPPAAPAKAAPKGGVKAGAKRKPEADPDNAGFEEEDSKRGRGRGGGRGAGRGSGRGGKEAEKNGRAAEPEKAKGGKPQKATGKAGAAGSNLKRRRAMDDDDD